MKTTKYNNVIKHITYNSGNVFEFNVKRKIRIADNARTLKLFTKIANKSLVENDILFVSWKGYLITVSALNKGIYNIFIMKGHYGLSANIFANNEITSLLLPEHNLAGDSFYLAQLEQLVACYLFYNPRHDLPVSDENFKSEDIPEILKGFKREHNKRFLQMYGKTG